jgi:ABC-type sugar transport system ATPase subunit
MADVSLQNVSKRFGAIEAVRELSLAVNDGEFVVLLGPSGAGKTTILRLITGLERPDAGSILIDGRDVTDDPPGSRDIAFVFQQYSLYPHLTVYDNLAFPLRSPARRVPEPLIKKRVEQTAELLHISSKLKNPATRLSGGEMQRVAIGRALVRDPSIYLMDEPLSSLDAKLRAELRLELKRIQLELGATILYVTHDQVEAMTMSDRVAVFSAGQLRQVAPPRLLYDAPDSLFVAQFLGESNTLLGTIEKRDGAHCAVALPGGATVIATAVGPCTVGSAVNVALRPEKIVLGAAAATCANRSPATLLEVSFLGDQLRLRLAALGRDDVVIKLPNGAGQETLEPGAALTIGWRAEDCRALAE